MQFKLSEKIVSTAMFAVLMTPLPSHANCEQADMAGVWHLFYEGGSVTMQISPAGEIIKGSYNSLLDLMVDIGYPKGELYGGSVEVLNNCRVVGDFPENEVPPNDAILDIHILDSRTRPDTQYWTGNLEITFDFGLGPYSETGSFNAVRILRY